MTAPCRLDLPRPPRGQECIETWIAFRVSQLRELAAWTACEYWRASARTKISADEIDIPQITAPLREERQHAIGGCQSP